MPTSTEYVRKHRAKKKQEQIDAGKTKNALRVAKCRATKKAKALEEAASRSAMETPPPKQVDVRQVLSGNPRAQLMYHASVEKQAMLDIGMQTYLQGVQTVRKESEKKMVEDLQTFLAESEKKANGFMADVAKIASTLPDSVSSPRRLSFNETIDEYIESEENEPPADRPKKRAWATRTPVVETVDDDDDFDDYQHKNKRRRLC